jgi:hypothetical protein
VEGLVVLIAEPPDLERLSCYGDAEASARSKGLGIWSAQSPLLKDTSDATPVAGGFLILKGKVTGIEQRGSGLHLSLDGRIAL